MIKFILPFIFFLNLCFAENIAIIADSIGNGSYGDKPFPVLMKEFYTNHNIISDCQGGSRLTAGGFERLIAITDQNKISKLIITLGINDILCTSVEEFELEYERIIKFCKRKHIKVYIGFIEATAFFFKFYNMDYLIEFENIYHRLLKKYNVKMFNFLYKEIIEHTYDGFHPNQYGQELIFKNIRCKIPLSMGNKSKNK